jgi:hypothetical protein
MTMADEQLDVWRELFAKWPAGIPKRGVLTSTLNEVTPFKSFMVKGEMLLLERSNPDALGARYVLMSFDAIHMLKLTDPLKEDVFKAAGFFGALAKV